MMFANPAQEASTQQRSCTVFTCVILMCAPFIAIHISERKKVLNACFSQHRPAILTSYTCFSIRYANCLPHYVLNGNPLWKYKLQDKAQKPANIYAKLNLLFSLFILYKLAHVVCLGMWKKSLSYDYMWLFIL